MTQPSLPDFAPRVPPRPSHVRSVSVAAYQQLKDSGELTARQAEFLDALDVFTHKYAKAPTLRELVDWAFRSGRIPTMDPNRWRPRCHELFKLGVVELLEKRPCRVSHICAHPVRVRQR